MISQPKVSVNDTVYFLHNNQVAKGKVRVIRSITSSPNFSTHRFEVAIYPDPESDDVKRGRVHLDTRLAYITDIQEHEIFKTKEELAEKLCQ